MDEDTAAICVLALLFLTILSTPLLITGCVAWGATRKWAADRRKHTLFPSAPSAKAASSGDVEASEGLISASSATSTAAEDDDTDEEDVDEDDFLDAEDARYHAAKKARKLQARRDREADLRLTTRAKFFKEWKKCWVGAQGGGTVEERKREQEFKEEEARRKIAREAVREYLRIERRRERKAARALLPAYGEGEKAE